MTRRQRRWQTGVQIGRAGKQAGRNRIVAIAQPWLARWLRILRASVGRVDKAHARRCELASLPQDVLRDTGLPPEDATGIASYQPDLPFFMQNGFGRS